MANTITNVLPKMLAQGVLALRQNAIGPRTVNRDYENIAAGQGNVINIPIPSAIAARAVTPAVAFAANVDSAPTVALVTLDHWFEAPYQASDSDAISVDAGFFPMQASEAIKALGNDADSFLYGKHVGFYGAVGAAGTTPFASGVTNVNSARTLLNRQLAPMDSRAFILDPAAEGALLGTTNVLQFDQRGDQGGIVQGSVGFKLGFQFFMDQNIPSFTPGTAWVTGYAVSGAGGAVGATTLTIVNATSTGQIKIGDIFTLTNGTQQYVITAQATVTVTASEVVISFQPGLATAVVSAGTLAVVATTYVANLAYNRFALAWASRPLAGMFGAGNVFQAPNDPVSGIALRLELSRQYKQETLSYDYLAGCGIVRRELGVKLFG